MATSTTPSGPACVAVARQEAPKGVILGAIAVVVLLFVVLMGVASHWEGGAMFVVMLLGFFACVVGGMIDDDRGARVWVQAAVLDPIAKRRSSPTA